MKRRHRATWLFVVAALVVACGVELQPPDKNLNCQRDKHCPVNLVCHPLLGQCLAIAAVDLTAPQLLSASASSATTVEVNFSERMAATALDIGAYRIVDAGDEPLSILEVTANDIEALQRVVLVTSPQAIAEPYTLTVQGLTDLQANPLSAVGTPPANQASFVGFGVPDTTPPQLLTVTALTSSTVSVVFSEPMNHDDVIAPATYTIVPTTGGEPIPIVQGVSENDQNVILVTSPLQPGAAYLLQLAAIGDLAGNLLPVAERSREFEGYGTNDNTPPEPLWPVASLEIEPQSLRFFWTSRIGASHYTIQIANTPDFAAPVLVETTIDAEANPNLVFTRADTPELFAPITYWWRVRANTTERAWTEPDYPTSYFDVITGAIFVSCPNDEECSDLGRVGNQTKPYTTIGRGISAASATAIPEVRIAARGLDAAYREAVHLTAGVHLMGGYDRQFTARDPATHPTIVANDDMTLLNASEINMIGTSVDGLVFAGGEATRQYAYGMQIANVCRFALRNCTLLPRAGMSKSVGLGIFSSGIVDTDLESPHFCPEPEILIEHNTIASGLAREWKAAMSLAVELIDSNVVLRHNFIHGGSASTQLSPVGDYIASAIKTISGTTWMDANTFYGGDVILDPATPSGGANVAQFAWTMHLYLGDHVLTNNLVVGGQAKNGNAGIYLSLGLQGEFGSAIVTNNTVVIDASLASGLPGEECYGVRFRQESDSSISFTNNLVAASGTLTNTTDFYAFRQDNTSYRRGSLQNNVAAGFARFYGNTNLVNRTAASINTESWANDNDEHAAASDIAFADFVGGDYHLSAGTPASIALGGKDASQPTCGPLFNQTCGEVMADLEGQPRTGSTDGSSYSVGAYEYD